MPLVGPIKDTNVPIVYDTDSGGFGGPLDMRGPEIGNVRYAQPGGNLALRITLEFGQPNTKYQVFLVCGAAHSASCGFTVIGSLATNAAGAGAAGITVPVAVLQNPPYGPGFRNDHIDLLAGVGNLSKGGLTAGAINYFVCKDKVGAPQAASASAIQPGDPLGGKAAGIKKGRGGGKKGR
jgi:hypothetical protein